MVGGSSSEQQLTTGVVAAIMSGVTLPGTPPCTLQIINIASTTSEHINGQMTRYRLMLSDGRHSCFAMVACALNDVAEQLTIFSFIQLGEYFLQNIYDKHILIVLSMVPVKTDQQWKIGRPEPLCRGALLFFTAAAEIAWGQRSCEWNPLLDVEALGPGRARAMLRAGANPHVRARPDVPSPLQLAHELRDSGRSSEAVMLVISAATWSPGSNALWPRPARKRASDLARIGWLLARFLPLDGHHEQAVSDIWLAHVVPRVLAFEFGRVPLTELLRERSLELLRGRPSISWTHDGRALLQSIERLRFGSGPARELTHAG